jgi:rubrerythrin
MSLRKIYEYALQREHEGKRFFETNASRMSHAAAAGIFHRLADEEQKHIEFIEAAIRALDDDKARGGGGVSAELEAEDHFSTRAELEMIDQTVIESMIPDVAVLRMAYLIERDFAEFYERAAQNAEGEAKRALTALSQWERGHEKLFKNLHDRVFEEYAEMPWGG